jgi:glycerol-3-phosphate dehydrogenase subunit C
VVDQCYLCDLCYMTKCPYVPPHEWNVDYPHTMLRAKAIKFKKGDVGFGEKFLSSTDVHGQFAGIPIVVQVANAVNQTKPARAAMEKVLHVDHNAWLPALATRKFRSAAPKSSDFDVKDGAKTPGKVAIFSTCYVNYNEPGIGLDLLKVLEHNEIPYVLVHKEKCCGMPKLELGDLESVNESKEANIPVLVKYAREGYAIVTAVPSCTLMFKQELPLMYPQDADVQAVKDAMWDPFEYLGARRRDGLLKTDFSRPLGKVSYHVPCHSRVQNIGRKTEELLKLLPGTFVYTNERCSGHAGTYGVKLGSHETAMKIGKPLFKRMAEHPQGGQPDYISSDCPLAGHHIDQGFDRNSLGTPQVAHPLTLVRMAYGLD